MNTRKSIFYSLLIVISFLSISYFLSIRFISELYYLKAKTLLEKEKYEASISTLKKALSYQPKNSNFLKELGGIFSALGAKQSYQESFELSKKARDSFLEASHLIPFDAEAVFGIAREEARLEILYPFIRRGENPYHALPYSEKLYRLSSNLVFWQMDFIRYLYHKEDFNRLLTAVTHLIRIYPTQYNALQKESFWSPEAKRAAKKGVLEGIEQGNDPLHAHGIMLSILMEEKDWKNAIIHKQRGAVYSKQLLGIRFEQSRYTMELGRLFLENGQHNEAAQAFLESLLSSKLPDKTLDSIYHTYRGKNRPDLFYQLCEVINSPFILDIYHCSVYEL